MFYPVKQRDGTVTGVGAIVEDVTERKRLERAEAVLSAELQHRVKNILSKVQAAATLTLKSSKSLEEFEETFSGRLTALVRAHDALSATSGSQPRSLHCYTISLRLSWESDRYRCASPTSDCCQNKLSHST